MSGPDARIFNSATADYLADLLDSAPDLTRQVTADRLGMSKRQLQNYLSGSCPIPYSVQFTIERMVGTGISDKDDPNTFK